MKIFQGTPDSSFVDVSVVPGQGIGNIIDSRHIVRLEVVEEAQVMMHGILRLRDPALIYSRILRTGVELFVGWGWARTAPSINAATLDDYAQPLSRRSARVMIQGPSGGGPETGDTYYNCNFMAMSFRGSQKARWWRTGTYAKVVTQMMLEMGIAAPDVRFAMGSTAITDSTAIMQANVTDFQFLVQRAIEWKAVFIVGYDSAGNPQGCFIDPYLVSSSPAVAAISGIRDSGIVLEYKVGQKPNVLEYRWQDHSGDSGVGDNVQVIISPDGRYQLIHRVVKGDTITTWRWDPAKANAAFKDAQSSDPATTMANWTSLLTQAIKANKFSEVKRYFDQVDSSTAPQGIGYTITGRMIGNTMMSPGMQPAFGAGFPDQLSSVDRPLDMYGNPVVFPPGAYPARPTRFYVNRSTHMIDDTGYYTEWDIVDAYALSNIGQPLTFQTITGALGG